MFPACGAGWGALRRLTPAVRGGKGNMTNFGCMGLWWYRPAWAGQTAVDGAKFSRWRTGSGSPDLSKTPSERRRDPDGVLSAAETKELQDMFQVSEHPKLGLLLLSLIGFLRTLTG